MKIVDVAEKFPPFEKPSGEAAYLIGTGQFKQYTDPQKPKKVQNLKWLTHEGHRIEDVIDSPFITCHCRTCGNTSVFTGATCHKTQQMRCCGAATNVPPEIATQYEKLRKEWEPKHKSYVQARQHQAQERERIRKLADEEERRLLVMKLRTPTPNSFQGE